MEIGKLLERVIAQNEIIISQNERLLRLLAERANKAEAGLLAELDRQNDHSES